MHLAERHSWDCGYWPEPAYRVTGGWNGHDMPDWSHQPPVDPNWVGGTWEGSTCGARTAKWNLTGMAATWAAAGQHEASVSLRATDEGDNNRWKKYASTEDGAPPALRVWFNRLPAVPTSVTPVYGQRLFTSGISVSATYGDPDGGAGYLGFGVWDINHTLRWSQWSAVVCSGCRATLSLSLPDGWYYVRAIGHDGQNLSPDWSAPYQWFFIDTLLPHIPTEIAPVVETILGSPGLVSARY